MKMLKLLGLMVFVVCIAAFASGCGGGGGGSATTPEEPPPVMECPQGQVGTYPDCMDPGPTDAERIAAARRILANIVDGATELALTASSVAAAVEVHPDATAEQIDSALVNAVAAQTALADVLAANSAGNAAATPAAAESAVADAQAALDELSAAQSAVASIESAVEAVASQRQQQVADETALTNNSSLIQLVRDNKLLSDALLEDLVADRLNVGTAGTTTRDAGTPAVPDAESCDSSSAPCATYAANTGTGATAVTGQRTVSVQNIPSNSKTTLLTGTGILPHGFDPDNGTTTTAATTYVNAYTDITQTRLNVRTRTATVHDDPDVEGDQRYREEDKPDTDYLIAGIWLTVAGTIADSTINAFAYGNQPIATTAQSFCSGIEGDASGVATFNTQGATTGPSTRRICANTTVNTIDAIVDDGKDLTATYRGNANGAYIAGGDTSYFTGIVELTAEFQNPTGPATATNANTGSIGGAVTNIVAGGQSMAGSIELQTQPLTDNISLAFEAGTAVGVVDGKSFSGDWKGQFFGHRVTRSFASAPDANDSTITVETTTYKSEAPGSVAGTFFVKQKSNPVDEAAFIGAFGAHR